MASGALLTITGIGAIIGIPLGMLGFAVMFPRFTKAVIILTILAVIVLLYLYFTNNPSILTL